MTEEAVALVMGLAFLGLVGLDLALAFDEREGNTYSELIRKAGKAWPFTRLLMAVAMGVLLGHWYW